ncbi:hypothetical protein BABINDRAFT_165990 [Babjeviella inositovora NRRL Y-12698]|uniref:SWR1-complex protein 5 n=1 Tax=Babjeviella inositovora NRRL Y-12698 TaxID=984486 RepID=A0A1E3QUF3_9ASCO|nr:uncharacterized protein BABINDRAFT_165990 [Babjeviella inositovora NRRL Y-12698]ODQ81300.1 hypothetical protein BABINDRAFT_165990 [Babjeviella inositovora NRRL Y-12698]
MARPKTKIPTDTAISASPTVPPLDIGEQYNEEEDDDFDPDAATAEPDGSSSEDDYDEPAQKGKDVPDYTHISGGGGLIKTRTQRAQEAQESKFARVGLSRTSGIDVNSIFDDMKKMSTEGRLFTPESTRLTPAEELQVERIQIERTYEFAGRVVSEKKMVDANSAEAKAYLNSSKLVMVETKVEAPEEVKVEEKFTKTGLPLRRPLKRPSLIDSILLNPKAVKLSTLEKSRLDWATYVDHNKISDELKTQGKNGFLDKQEFLHKVDMKQYNDLRDLRNKDRKTNPI